MINIGKPNISIDDNLVANNQTLVNSKPQVTIHNHVYPSHPTEDTNAQPSTIEIETQEKRITITSWILIAIGGISALSCLWTGF
jgi:hypothetical protein